jgi:DNA-binding IclR family transcriptional regulator
LTATDLASTDREHNKASARILRVLSAFVADASGFGVTELSLQLHMTKNMVYRALTTLVEQGYLVRDPANARYELSYRILELQNPNLVDPDFRALCAPFMRMMSELTGESVSLTVRAQDFTVFIDGIEARKPGAYRTLIGALRPLHANTSGRVVLSFLADAEIEAYIARHKPMRVTNPDGALPPAELWREVAMARKDGRLSMLRGDAPLMAAVAFPVWDADGRVHGVLSVGGPEERFGDKLKELMPEMQAIVDALCRRTRLYSANSAGSEIE